MAVEVRLADEAKADLLSIGDYIGRDNPSAAERQLHRLLDGLDLLKEFPLAGREAPELGSAFRFHVVDKYLILYRVHGQVLEVYRVIHPARDVPRLLGEP